VKHVIKFDVALVENLVLFLKLLQLASNWLKF